MVIAVSIVLMVQMPIYQIVNMVSVWNRFMPTTWTVNMICRMRSAIVASSTFIWIGLRHFDSVLGNFSLSILMMQVPVMQIIDMPFMLNGCMTT